MNAKVRSYLIESIRRLLINGTLNILVMGGYVLLGLLGKLHNNLDQIIPVLRPEAGLALAATLLLGYKVAPGVILGQISLAFWSLGVNAVYLPYYAASAIGCALAPMVIAIIIRRYDEYPNALVYSHSINRFMLLGGLGSASISALFNVLGLLYVQLIDSNQLLQSGLRFWLADVFGIFIVTPALFCLVAKPYLIWRRRRLTVALPVLFSLFLVFILFVNVKQMERERFTDHVTEDAVFLANAIEQRLAMLQYAVNVARESVITAGHVDESRFKPFVARLIKPFPELLFLDWNKLAEQGGILEPFISVVNGIDADRGESWRILPGEIRKRMSKNLQVRTDMFMLHEKNRLKIIAPIGKDDNAGVHIDGVMIGGLSVEKFLQNALAGINVNHCSFTIGLQPEKGETARTIYDNHMGDDAKPHSTMTIPVLDQFWRLEFFHDWEGENIIYEQSSLWILMYGNGIVGLLGIVLLHLTGRAFRAEELIAERTRSLSEMKASAELANTAKNKFLAKVSHELRTPLNGISGFAQLLEKKPTLRPEDKHQVGIIRQCCNSLLKLIDDILDISSIESQFVTPEKIGFDLDGLLKDCYNICQFRANEKGLEIFFHNSCIESLFVGDEKRIRQILVNLIDNAIKYTQTGTISVASSYEEGLLKIVVADTGCGIEEQYLEKIFTPFVQVGLAGVHRDGVGLGLSITKELVHLMEGTLEVSSEPGIGSMFTVSLPLAACQKPELKRTRKNPASTMDYSHLRVLAVDDNEINLLLIINMLEQMGSKVDAATNGQEALEKFQDQHYDLALIDISMPVMSGLELVQRLRRRPEKLNLVAVSASVDNHSIEEALKVGFDAYITKPIEESHLVEVIKNLEIA